MLFNIILIVLGVTMIGLLVYLVIASTPPEPF